jgi:lipoyl-dependent peroxiredoxin
MKRKASAVWTGDLKSGKGTMSTDSKVLVNTPYSFSTRFESVPGTNPEELVAAAHAGCFSMALSAILGDAGLKAESIQTTATLTMEQVNGNWTTTEIHLDTKAKVPGADKAKFDKAAHDAEVGCPISRLLNTKITMTATLEV